MSDDVYIERANEAIERAREKVRQYNGECRDCVYSYRATLGLKCSHPAVELVAFNLYDAPGKRYVVECDEQRSEKSVWGPVVCGPNGALFEQKPPTLWQRLFGK